MAAASLGAARDRRRCGGESEVPSIKKARGFCLRGHGIILLLLIPVPFYALSVAYGGVPIFIPAMVAVHPLQRSLRIAVAAGVRGMSLAFWHIWAVQSEKLEAAAAFRRSTRASRVRACELRLDLARHAYLPERSPDQHANAQPA